MTHHTTTSSHLVPTSSQNPGTTSESTSSRRPLPVGDEVELASTDNHPKNTHLVPPNGTTTIKITCPTHGPQIFERSTRNCLWICPISPCITVVLDEHITPDGAHVTDLAQLGWGDIRDWAIERISQGIR